jgi:hypothetical protein
MQRAFEIMCNYSLKREAFGSTLAEKQTVQNWIADSAAEIQAARLLTMHAAYKIDQGDEARVEISIIKFWGARVLHDVIDRAIQVHGARGVSGDTPLESMYRQARAARIYDGPDEVHRMVVARRILREFSQATPGTDHSAAASVRPAGAAPLPRPARRSLKSLSRASRRALALRSPSAGRATSRAALDSLRPFARPSRRRLGAPSAGGRPPSTPRRSRFAGAGRDAHL